MGKRNELPFSDIDKIGYALVTKEDIQEAEEGGFNVILLEQVGELDPILKMIIDQTGMDYKKLSSQYKAIVVKFKNGIV